MSTLAVPMTAGRGRPAARWAWHGQLWPLPAAWQDPHSAPLVAGTPAGATADSQAGRARGWLSSMRFQAVLQSGTPLRRHAQAERRRRRRAVEALATPVTHCPTCGSEYTYNPSGRHRRCKVCESTSQKASRRRAKTHCKHKHLLEGDNVIVCSNGTRKCRTCEESRIAKSAAWLTDKWADDPDGMTTAMKRGRWPAAS